MCPFQAPQHKKPEFFAHSKLHPENIENKKNYAINNDVCVLVDSIICFCAGLKKMHWPGLKALFLRIIPKTMCKNDLKLQRKNFLQSGNFSSTVVVKLVEIQKNHLDKN